MNYCVGFIAYAITNKNAFQYDVYQPLIDHMPRGVPPSRRVSYWEVSYRGLLPGGLLWEVVPPSWRVSLWGGFLYPGGLLLWVLGVYPSYGGASFLGGGIPACTEADPRITDTSKNITLKNRYISWSNRKCECSCLVQYNLLFNE